jgi:dihydrofolate synthase/folylpolyglutamate synthase
MEDIMTYEEARKFIEDSNQYGCVPGLETITELLDRLGNPQDNLKIIHVAGTNGKGSVSAYIATILSTAGYRVGRYLSPSVFSYREKIQISGLIPFREKENNYSINPGYAENDHLNHDKILDNVSRCYRNNKMSDYDSIGIEYITKEGVSAAIERIKPICVKMQEEGFAHPTSFEIETAMAMLYLYWEQVDFTVLEVGLGGRLDATNVIKHPVCSVITSISMDHMQLLGDTLEKIAGEKAGIIKKGAPAISCRQKPEVIKVLEDICRQKETKLFLSEFQNLSDIQYTLEETTFVINSSNKRQKFKLRLLGEYQVENAVLAMEAVKQIRQLGYSINDEAVKKGLYETRWSGRFEVISKKPYLIIDGAHNEAAAIVLRNSIQLYFTNRRIIYMIGVLADKDYRCILKITAPLADVIFTLTPNNSRALSSFDLAVEASKYNARVIDAKNLNNAMKLAYQEASEEDIIIAFGSLSFLSDLVKTEEIRKGDFNYDR